MNFFLQIDAYVTFKPSFAFVSVEEGRKPSPCHLKIDGVWNFRALQFKPCKRVVSKKTQTPAKKIRPFTPQFARAAAGEDEFDLGMQSHETLHFVRQNRELLDFIEESGLSGLTWPEEKTPAISQKALRR